MASKPRRSVQRRANFQTGLLLGSVLFAFALMVMAPDSFPKTNTANSLTAFQPPLRKIVIFQWVSFVAFCLPLLSIRKSIRRQIDIVRSYVSRLHVGWINAQSVIANMMNVQAWRYRSHQQFIGCPMSLEFFALSTFKPLTVSFSILGSCPVPTVGYRISKDMGYQKIMVRGRYPHDSNIMPPVLLGNRAVSVLS